jgi:hypothetical protein
MTAEIATSQSFQERMFAKIRDQMGDLMTDDDLKKLVDVAMKKAFFEDRRTGEGYHSTVKPPLFVELIEKQLREEVSRVVAQWVAEHPEDVTKAIDAALAKGIFGLVVQHFESKTSMPLYQLAENLKQKGLL